MSKLIILILLFAGAGVCVLALHALHQIAMRKRVVAQLRKRVKNLRLNKMLEYLGADREAYFRHVPDSVIEQQIYRCSHCTNTEICDDCLQDRRCVMDRHFCPNYTSLLAQSRHLYKA